MSRIFKKALAPLIGFALILTMSVGCGKSADPKTEADTQQEISAATTGSTEQTDSKEELKPIKFTASFGIGFPDGQDGPFDDDIAKEITRITGVEIENIPLGESVEARDTKLNIMLASGDYPEILRLNAGIEQKYIREGVLLPLNELIDKSGPNIKRVYGEETLRKMINPEDGNLYHLSSWHGYIDPKTNGGFFAMNIKHDLLQQIAPEIADSNDYITPDKFYELLKEFKVKFPTIDGKASIPLTFSVDQKFYDGSLTILGVLKSAYGIQAFSEDADHNLKIDIKDSKYVEILKFLNKLQREKLIDSEWPTLKYQVYGTKLVQGNVFSTSGAWFETMGANTEISKEDPNAQYYSYVLAADGITNPPLCTVTDTGSELIALTKKCSDPERAIKFFDFLASEDGNFLTFYGTKGGVWDDIDGKRQIKPDVVDEFQNDVAAFWKKYQIRKWNIVNAQEPFLTEFTYSDGTKFELPPKADTPFQRYFDFACKSLANTGFDQWAFSNIGPLAGSDEFNIVTKFGDIKEKEIFKIIIESKDDNDVQNRLNTLIDKANELGIEKYEKFISDKYKVNLAQLK